MIRDTESFSDFLHSLRRFVREVLVPSEHEVAAADAIPEGIVRQMKALGLFELSIPESFGGAGLTMEEVGLAVLELGRTSPALRSLFGTNIGIGSQGLILARSPDSGIGRFYRDVRLFRIYEGTSQIQQLIIARDMIRHAEST